MKLVQAMPITVLLMAIAPAYAGIPPAYERVAERYGVPPLILFSVALQESGRTVRGRFLPWPWTLNIDNKAHYFESREAAEAALRDAMFRARLEGRTGRVAVGLGQIYMPSHRKAFDNDIQALDPTVNLHYAAMLLASEYLWTVKQGRPNWAVAVGRYHTPSRADLAMTYRNQVLARCRKIDPSCALISAEHLAQLTGDTQ